MDCEMSEVSGTRMSLRERPQRLRPNKSKDFKEANFLQDFDPEHSNREKRKLKRKMNGTSSKTSTYDEHGHIRSTGVDLCDCLDERCPGCWYECENCNSTKCGVLCRVNRKIYFECINFDGKDIVIPNKFINIK